MPTYDWVTAKLPNTGALRSVAQFYDDRVENPTDLNARLSKAASRPANHHSGIVFEDESVPKNEQEALIWLYDSDKFTLSMFPKIKWPFGH